MLAFVIVTTIFRYVLISLIAKINVYSLIICTLLTISVPRPSYSGFSIVYDILDISICKISGFKFNYTICLSQLICIFL